MDAIDNAPRNPENTIFSVKRLMGRYYDDPHIREVQARYRYKLVKLELGEDVRSVLGGRVLTPTEVSAMILRKLRADAEQQLAPDITHAVITVPAYFSMNQKLATRQAGEMAGLRVKTIIDEPSAAAIAFGIDLDPARMRYILVYDLGGGTFDISLLNVAGGLFDQLAIEGDMWLGGDDFDHAMMGHVLRQIREQYHVDLSGDARFVTLLRQACERAKCQLSSEPTATLTLDAAIPVPNGFPEDVHMTFTRQQFEELPISTGPRARRRH